MLNWKRRRVSRLTVGFRLDRFIDIPAKKGAHFVLPPSLRFFNSYLLDLLARSGLHAVAGFAEFQGDFLASEAGSCQ